MNLESPDKLTLHTNIESWPLAMPFRISGRVFELVEILVVTLRRGDLVGRGEAAGVYYKDDRPESMQTQIEALRSSIEAGITLERVQEMLPPGGARNALDCALWELEARTVGQPVWQRAGVGKPKRLLTTFTCGAEDPKKMAVTAQAYKDARAIKLKLTGDPVDVERVQAVREARTDVWLGVDGNQGFTRRALERLLPTLIEMRVELIEQPFPVGQEALLDGLQSPIALAADESVQSLADIQGLVGRVNVINIKLDKCGGLTEGLAMAHAAKSLGLDAMVGNMIGTSLAMAPAFLVGQLCRYVDLDGPALLKFDRAQTVRYIDGHIECPDTLWG